MKRIPRAAGLLGWTAGAVALNAAVPRELSRLGDHAGRLDRLKPGSRFMRRYTRRTFAGALAISTGESFIGASQAYSSRGCQSASAVGGNSLLAGGNGFI